MIQSSLLSAIPHLIHGYSDRSDGNLSIKASELSHKQGPNLRSEAYQNRLTFLDSLNVASNDLILSRQVHGDVIEEVTSQYKNLSQNNESPFTAADGLFTSEENTYLAVFSADCLPIFIVDPVEERVAAIHAGWRGLAEQIVPKAINRLIEKGSKAAQLIVWIGPHIQSCHYRLTPDNPSYDQKKTAFKDIENVVVIKDGQEFLDLTEVAMRQLEETGVAPVQVDVHAECTACHPDRYYSYHAAHGQVDGIMMGVIGLKK